MNLYDVCGYHKFIIERGLSRDTVYKREKTIRVPTSIYFSLYFTVILQISRVFKMKILIRFALLVGIQAETSADLAKRSTNLGQKFASEAEVGKVI